MRSNLIQSPSSRHCWIMYWNCTSFRGNFSQLWVVWTEWCMFEGWLSLNSLFQDIHLLLHILRSLLIVMVNFEKRRKKNICFVHVAKYPMCVFMKHLVFITKRSNLSYYWIRDTLINTMVFSFPNRDMLKRYVCNWLKSWCFQYQHVTCWHLSEFLYELKEYYVDSL